MGGMGCQRCFDTPCTCPKVVALRYARGISNDDRKDGTMSTGCQVCGGAIPEGERVEGHTALCAEVLGQRYRARIALLEAVASAARDDLASYRTVGDTPTGALYLAVPGVEAERRLIVLRDALRVLAEKPMG